MKNKRLTFFKVINSVILLLVVVVGIFGFLANNQEIKVEAAVKSGYLVNCGGSITFNSSTGQCLDLGTPIASECELGYSTTSTQFLLCGQKSNLSPGETLRYKVCQNGQTECDFEGNKYTGCNTVGSSDSGFVLCSTVSTTTTTTNQQGSSVTTTTTKINKTDSKAGITCDITITNFNVVDSRKTNLNYTLGDCVKDGAKLPNASFSCIAWVIAGAKDANDVKFGCSGGDEAKALTFDEGGMVVWDSDQCYAFFTATGSACIKEGEIASACGGAGFGVSSFNRTLFGLTVGAFPCAKKDFATFKAANPILSDIISGPEGIAGTAGGTLSDECKGARDAAIADNKKEFTCNNGQKYTINDQGQVVAPDGVTTYDNNGNAIKTATGDGKSTTEKAVDAAADLGKFIWQIGAGILAVILFIFGTIALVVLYFFGAIVLFFLSINPASADAFAVAAQPWGVLVGVANLIILAAFMYVGFGYLLGIEDLKKNLGEFIQKIIYYAILLNFTLSGAATLVNIGYGMGNLIKVGYAGTTSGQELNYALMGNVLNSIGKVSLLRCGDKTADCVIYDNQKGGSPDFFKFPDLGKAFGSPDSATQSAVREGMALIMAGFAIYVFWRVLKVVLFRFVGIWMIMILSPLGLASYFSPIESWQSLGKNMWGKFLKFVLFYPAFIFALILVNLLSGTFSTRFVKSDTQVAASSGFLESLVSATSVVLGAVVSMTALYYVTKYFADSFDEDMGKIGEAVGKGWEGTKKGFSGAWNTTKFAHRNTIGLGGRLGNTAIKAGFKATGNEKAYDALSEKFKTGPLRSVGNFLTGKTMYNMEARAKVLKNAWEGRKNINKMEIEGEMGRQEAFTEASLRKIPGYLGGNFIADGLNATEGAHFKNALREDLDDEYVHEIAKDVGESRAGDVVKGKPYGNSQMKKAIRGMVKRNEVGEQFKEMYEQALKEGNIEILQMIATSPLLKDKAKDLYRDLDQDARKAVQSKYGSFLQSDTSVVLNAESNARDRNHSLSNIDMADDNYRTAYTNELQKMANDGDKDAERRLKNIKSSKDKTVSTVKARAEANINGADYDKVIQGLSQSIQSQTYKQTSDQLEQINSGAADIKQQFEDGLNGIDKMNEAQFEQFTNTHGFTDLHQDLKNDTDLKEDFESRKLAFKKAVEGVKDAEKVLQSTPVKQLQKESEVLQAHTNNTASSQQYKELGLIKGGLETSLKTDFEDIALQEYQNSEEYKEDSKHFRTVNPKLSAEGARAEALKQKQQALKASSAKIQEHVRIAATETDVAKKEEARQKAKDEVSKHVATGWGNAHNGIDSVVDNTQASGSWDADLVNHGQNQANITPPDRVAKIDEQIGAEIRNKAVLKNEIIPDDINPEY